MTVKSVKEQLADQPSAFRYKLLMEAIQAFTARLEAIEGILGKLACDVRVGSGCAFRGSDAQKIAGDIFQEAADRLRASARPAPMKSARRKPRKTTKRRKHR